MSVPKIRKVSWESSNMAAKTLAEGEEVNVKTGISSVDCHAHISAKEFHEVEI